MDEKLLHYIWQFQKFDHSNLQTDLGASLSIFNTGHLNTDAGPDFQEAKICIDGIIWAGNIEIHTKASHWQLHKHQHDKAYNNVVLHVVWENDYIAHTAQNFTIPTLSLCGRVPSQFLEVYHSLMQSQKPIACYDYFAGVNPFQKTLMLEKALIERLQNKAEAILEALEGNQNDWEQTAYQTLAKAMGFSINAAPFERLAAETPIKILRKHQSLAEIEAMLFGQAGFLEHPIDEYSENLAKNYQYFRSKYQLKSTVSLEHWKFLRLRPGNFPSLRLAQFAQIIFQTPHLFSAMVHASSTQEVWQLFSLTLNPYWQVRNNFGQLGAITHSFGKDSRNLLLINAVAPLLVAYALDKAEPSFTDKAIDLLAELPSENNKITRFWQSMALPIESAAQSQGALEWFKNRCSKKKCLSCSVAHNILNSDK